MTISFCYIYGFTKTGFRQWGFREDEDADNYMFNFNNRNTRTRCEKCSKLTIKTPERRQYRRSGFFIVNFEHISCCGVSIVNLEQVNAGWGKKSFRYLLQFSFFMSHFAAFRKRVHI